MLFDGPCGLYQMKKQGVAGQKKGVKGKARGKGGGGGRRRKIFMGLYIMDPPSQRQWLNQGGEQEDYPLRKITRTKLRTLGVCTGLVRGGDKGNK